LIPLNYLARPGLVPEQDFQVRVFDNTGRQAWRPHWR
jgi:hypothetical protein